MFRGTGYVLAAFALLGLATIACGAQSNSEKELCYVMPAGSYILKPQTCTQWVRCPMSGRSDYEEGACVRGLYYNKDLQRCDASNKVKCPYSDKSAASQINRCLRQKDGVFLADANNCNGYIYCKQGAEFLANCPENLVFHPNRSSCVYPNEYPCESSREGVYSSPACRSIPINMKFADVNDCAKYQMCVNGTIKSASCAKNQGFDHIKGKCMALANLTCIAGSKKPEPENTFCGTKDKPKVGYYSDGKSCTGYYYCGPVHDDGTPDRSPLHFTCETGLFFDPDRLSCHARLQVNCPYDRCEGMGNGYANVAGNCAAYARCNKGITLSIDTCRSNTFFDERTQGCIATNYNFPACASSLNVTN